MEVEIVECLFFLLKFGWLNSIHFCFSTLEKFILQRQRQNDNDKTTRLAMSHFIIARFVLHRAYITNLT